MTIQYFKGLGVQRLPVHCIHIELRGGSVVTVHRVRAEPDYS